MAEQVYLAVDLGAESGRVMAGKWNGRRILLEEVYRFPNAPVTLAHTLRWDVLHLWAQIQHGLNLAKSRYGDSIVSVGVDTWGLDFVLLNQQDELLGLPYHYRDNRTAGLMEKAFDCVPRAEIFAQTGLQFLPFNSLYQLLAWKNQAPELLESAHTLLFMPDFFHWAMCGVKRSEWTIASTSQFVRPVQRQWALPLLEKFALPTHFLPRLVPPGTRLGRWHGCKINVVTPPAHDTASAVAAVPATTKSSWAYISSGTWSLMGVELKKPILTGEVLRLNLTNETGIDGTCRLLKNLMGLWLVQRCKQSFAQRGRVFSYAQLTSLAARAQPLRSLVNVNDNSFLNPPDMPLALQNYCRLTKQPVPESEGELIRCALESLALGCRKVLAALEQVTQNTIDTIHIVGGGGQNKLLNQFTADACQRRVITGPVEATAMGNLLTQVRAAGELDSLAELRQTANASSACQTYEPRAFVLWQTAAQRLALLD